MSWSIFLTAVPTATLDAYVAAPRDAAEQLYAFQETHPEHTMDFCHLAEIVLAALMVDDAGQPPLADLLFLATEADQIQLDLCRIASAEQVAASAPHYAQMTDQMWLARLQADDVQAVLAENDADDDTFDEILDVFHALQTLVRDAASHGDGIIWYYA